MLYREIMAVCSEIHTKHINTVCGQNVELLNVKLVVRIVTTGLQRLRSDSRMRYNCYLIVLFARTLNIQKHFDNCHACYR